MKKRIILVALFVIFTLFLSASTVSANSATENFNISEADDFSLDSIENQDLTTSDENENISNGNEYTSFAALNATITSGSDVVEITTNYSFNDETDENFIKGIMIFKNNLVINGNNHTIDAEGKSAHFLILGKNVTINNLILKNANGSSVFIFGSLKTNNVEFNNCSGKFGAVTLDESEYISENDRFMNNQASYAGAAIYATDSNITVENGLIENSHNVTWSLIYSEDSNITVINTTFANSTSKYATAIYNSNGQTKIKKSRFINLFANLTAGAIAIKFDDNVTIEDCEFINISSRKNGGAIFIDINAKGDGEGFVLINNTLFEDCSSEFGGAYLQLGGSLEMINTNFKNNYAEYNGGAIYLSDTQSNIENCIFTLNTVNLTDEYYPTYGGALFIDDSNMTMNTCRFINNHAIIGSGFYSSDSLFDIDNVEFSDNGNAIYTIFDQDGSSAKNLFGNDKIKREDFDNTYYPMVVSGAGMEMNLINITINSTIPTRYDLREEGLVTPVRDQGSMGACWAFGMIGALESALLKYMNYSADFSENNMQNSMLTYSPYGNINLYEGGDSRYGMAYLLSWLGAFPKDYDEYDELGKISPTLTTPENIHIQDIIIIRHIPGNDESINNVKEAILKYGALSAYLLSKSSTNEGEPTGYFNKNTSAEYAPDHLISNHAICVVGWDDNYSKDNFNITPPGDGAWIAKNSWGTDWGDEGYFYISYYDQTLCAFPERISETFIAIVLENTLQYDNNYQYDFAGLEYFYEETGKQLKYTNTFESAQNEAISAVGTYFNKEGERYKIEIKVNGNSVYTQTGISPYYGYHTIKLNKNISIDKGDKFSVTITSNAIPICNNSRVHYQNESSIAIFSEGYEDLSAEGLAACLKVYTFNDDRTNTQLITPNRVIYVNDAIQGYDYQFILKDENNTGIANKEVMVSFNDKNQTVKTDEKGWGTVTLKVNAEGTYGIKVTFQGDEEYRDITQTAKLTLVKEKTTLVAPDRTVYVKEISKGYQYSAILKDNNGKPLANKKILFTFNGKKQIVMTDEKGWATVTLTATEPGTQTITIKFTGDRYYRPTTTTKTITIVKEKTTLVAPDRAVYVQEISKGYKYSAILKDNNGKPLANKKILFTFNGKEYTATTKDNGWATVTLTATEPGTQTITIKFTGDRYYRPTTATKTINIIANKKK